MLLINKASKEKRVYLRKLKGQTWKTESGGYGALMSRRASSQLLKLFVQARLDFNGTNTQNISIVLLHTRPH